MNKRLFSELMRFARSKKNKREQLRYILLSLIYFLPLSKNASGAAKGNTSLTGNETGDDIYPLF